MRVLQMRLLKKMVGAPTSTTNSFLLLELGVLPIDAEIHKRQLMYLHRILALPDDDPVHQMFVNMMALDGQGEANWWSGVKLLITKYNLPSLEEIKCMKKEAYKRLVNESVELEAET